MKNTSSSSKECHRNQRSMSLGGPAHESLLQKSMRGQPQQTLEISRGESGEQVALLVESTKFIVNPALLVDKPDTMLGRMFCMHQRNGASNSATKTVQIHSRAGGSSLADPIGPIDLVRPNERDEFEVAEGISAECFRTALDYYHNGGRMRVPSSVSVLGKHGLDFQVRAARSVSLSPTWDNRAQAAAFPQEKLFGFSCDYLLIPFTASTIQCNDLRGLLHELSNEGARAQFNAYLEALILPQLVIAAERGDRECHIIVLLDDDVVDWDEDYPPQMEDVIQVVYSTPLYKFFKYAENRDVAKQVLKDRKLKKIRISVEGYPTHKEKIKRRFNREEVIYSYVQRPFLHCSWEKEEARSRHVDFACPIVKSKSNPSLASAASDPIPQPAPLHLYMGDELDGGIQQPPPPTMAADLTAHENPHAQQPHRPNNIPRGSPSPLQNEGSTGGDSFLLSVAGVHIANQRAQPLRSPPVNVGIAAAAAQYDAEMAENSNQTNSSRREGR